jgi:hypothetical protein
MARWVYRGKLKVAKYKVMIVPNAGKNVERNIRSLKYSW